MSKPSRALIVRSYQKDFVYIKKLESKLLEMLDLFIENKYRYISIGTVNILSKLIYYMGTTSNCLQTLGEEYTNLIAIQRGTTDELKVPSILTLNLYSIVQSFSHLCGKMFVTIVIKCFRLHYTLSNEELYQIRNKLNGFFQSLQSLNISLFYLQGHSYRFLQKLMGIQYVTTLSESTDHLSTLLFQIIGLVNIIRSFYTMFTLIYTDRYQSQSQSNMKSIDRGFIFSRCGLCLEEHCQDATAVLCGHVFCWNCIVNETRRSGCCPLCRIRCHPSRLIYLQN